MTKADLIQAVQEQLPGCTRREAAQVVEASLEILKESLEGGDDVLISGFGKFQVRGKRARRGRNPRTRDELILPARRVVTFRPSPVLRSAVNGEED